MRRGLLLLPLLFALSACEETARPQPPQAENTTSAPPQSGPGTTNVTVVVSGQAGGLRFSGDVPEELTAPAEGPAPVHEFGVWTQGLPTGELTLVVALTSSQKNDSPLALALKELGFTAPKEGTPGEARLFQRILSAGRGEFLAALAKLTEQAAHDEAEFAAERERARHPGQLTRQGENWAAGKLAFTGHPLDVALAQKEDTARLIEVISSYKAPQTRSGCLGGRIYLGANRALCLGAETLAGFEAVPADALSVSVQKDGQVVAALPNNQTKVLGKLHVVSVPKLKSTDGRHFDLDGAADVANVSEVLLPGHLEFAAPSETLAASVRAAAQRRELAAAIELALAQPLPGPAAPGPVSPNAEPPAKNIVLAAEVPLAVAQLKALGIAVESTPGQTVIPVGLRPEERQRAVANLTKVLQGLLKRMGVSQQNYVNANKVRDEQGQLNPYRRKMVKVGPEGQLVEDEDPSEFRKELKPGHPDARPDGNVIYPNVNRKVEKADFEAAGAEYQLLRTALERLAPMTIFPEAPALPVLPPEPEDKKP